MNTLAKSQNGRGPIERRAYKIGEAAKLVGVSPISIRRAIGCGQLRVCRAFRHILIPANELEEFLTR
jgi:excisionase family DNA binding protein